MLAELQGTPRLMAMLLYGSGLRLFECAGLRIKDADFGLNQIVVRDGKGEKDRVTLFPAVAQQDLARHIDRVRAQHQQDLARGAGWVELPFAPGREYPEAGRECGWQWVFPATRTYFERQTRQRRRHHLHESVLQREVKQAIRQAGIPKPASSHTFRHSFATICLRTVTTSAPCRSCGHKDVSTTMMTMIYTHVLNRGPTAVRSPADRLLRP
ncbi:MAG TPA: tyrosine-type recombinase/integrase [Dehalococcoidia bacterium]|nr:tyrosine-type recombinase/integrase [Dehalococcoidia bacterium]